MWLERGFDPGINVGRNIGFGLSTVFSFAVFFYGVKMVQSEYILGQVTPSMQWPEWIYGCFVPFGAVFMTIRFAQITLEEIHTDR